MELLDGVFMVVFGGFMLFEFVVGLLAMLGAVAVGLARLLRRAWTRAHSAFGSWVRRP